MAEYPRQEPSICGNPAENVQVDATAAQNAAQHGPRTEHAPDLAKVIDAWPSLTSEARQAVLEIVAGKPDLKPQGL